MVELKRAVKTPLQYFMDRYLMYEKDYIDNNIATFRIPYTKHHNTENPEREHRDAELLEQLLQQKGIEFVRGWQKGSDPSRGYTSYSIFKAQYDIVAKEAGIQLTMYKNRYKK